jgi:NAD(P)-dependent dehydrogenase (short-subunit alcohol dehydrogenase family)
MRAFVTGGASGIGAAVCRRLAQGGYDVGVADVQDDRGKAVASEVGGEFVHLDVGDADAWPGLLEGVDLVHLNAGFTTQEGDLSKLTVEQYRRVMAVNTDGVVFGLMEAYRSMPDGGAVVATASVAGLLGFPPDPIYTLTKHAVVGLVRACTTQPRLTVNAVCPGIVHTPLLGDEMARYLKDLGYQLIDPGQVADAVLAAATSGRTGECWTVLPGQDNRPFTFAPVPIPPVATT